MVVVMGAAVVMRVEAMVVGATAAVVRVVEARVVGLRVAGLRVAVVMAGAPPCRRRPRCP